MFRASASCELKRRDGACKSAPVSAPFLEPADAEFGAWRRGAPTYGGAQ
jgi:hypothetical protein